MTKTGGAAARTLSGFTLGRELRAHRIAAGLAPKQLAALSQTPRTKIDALELGYYGSDERKRAARLTREEFVRLLRTPALAIGPETGSALLYLAYETGAIGGGEVFHPLTSRDWPGAKPQSPHTTAGAARATCARHESAFRAPATPTRSPEQDWLLPTRRCRAMYGRDDLATALRAAILSPEGPGMILVSGFPGIGKSELVREALDSDEMRASFAGLRWISARQRELVGGPGLTRSAEQITDAEDVLRNLARALRTTVEDLGQTLAKRRWLIVIDNAESVRDEDQLVSRLAPIVGAGRIVVTSRSRYHAAFLRPFPASGELPGLDAVASAALLADEALALGHGSRAISDEMLAQIHQVTHGAPLALHWLVGRGARQGLVAAAAELSAGTLNEIYEFMFNGKWSRTTSSARDVLAFLALRAVEPVPTAVLYDAGVAKDEVGAALEELGEVVLVEAIGDAVGLHPLTATFVRTTLGDRSVWARDEAGRAWRAGIAHLLRAIDDDRSGSRAVEELGGLQNYLSWMRDATSAGSPEQTIHAWLKFSRFLWEHWHWEHFDTCEEIGREAIEALAGKAPEAARMLRGITLTDVAYHMRERSRIDESLERCAAALVEFDALGDDAGRGLAHRYAGLAHLRADRTREARASFEAAMDCVAAARSSGFPRPGSRAEEAAHQLRDLALWQPLRAAYATYRGSWGPSEAELSSLIGGVLLLEGSVADATRWLERAVDTYLASDDRWAGSEAGPMITLGRCRVMSGDLERGRETLAQALAIAQRAGRRELAGGALLQLAELDLRLGRSSDARAEAHDALAIAQNLGQVEEAARAARVIESST